MFCFLECKIRGFKIYKNVHNVQNFVYNYKNKYFDFKSAWNPYIYWIWYFITVSWQNNYKVLAKVWNSIKLGICGLFEPLFDNRCPREKNTQKSKLLLDKAFWQRNRNSNFCILIFVLILVVKNWINAQKQRPSGIKQEGRKNAIFSYR